ncbi:hypothetical protein Tco_0838224 [Tanacetum coccineum]|uniref:Reverse transcriptase domain-containing protein n=1 Tax=Tanacetum coccineum TaxID=301880 RepID=A0ABQ5AQI4_9ASTR
MPLEGIHVDDKLQFVEEPVEIMEREIKRLKRSWIPLVKVCWNSRRGIGAQEFPKNRERFVHNQKYPHTLHKAEVVISLLKGLNALRTPKLFNGSPG